MAGPDTPGCPSNVMEENASKISPKQAWLCVSAKALYHRKYSLTPLNLIDRWQLSVTEMADDINGKGPAGTRAAL